jgi:hypothetical protein
VKHHTHIPPHHVSHDHIMTYHFCKRFIISALVPSIEAFYLSPLYAAISNQYECLTSMFSVWHVRSKGSGALLPY